MSFFFFKYNLITKLSANPTGGKKFTNQQCVLAARWLALLRASAADRDYHKPSPNKYESSLQTRLFWIPPQSPWKQHTVGINTWKHIFPALLNTRSSEHLSPILNSLEDSSFFLSHFFFHNNTFQCGEIFTHVYKGWGSLQSGSSSALFGCRGRIPGMDGRKQAWGESPCQQWDHFMFWP